jgi:hypothetical protein
MNYLRAIRPAKSARHRRLAVIASVTAAILATATLLAVAHPHATLSPDTITAMHAAWMRVAAPGMQFPAGRLTARALRIWLGGVSTCCLPRFSFPFTNISVA